jgi:hypothetical protein
MDKLSSMTNWALYRWDMVSCHPRLDGRFSYMGRYFG